MDCTLLEGKPILYNTGMQIIEAKVAAIDPDIGLTITDLDGVPLTCLRGPLSPQARNVENYPLNLYRQVFQFYIEDIEKGVIDAVEMDEAENGYPHNSAVSRDDCAFAQ